MAVPFTSLDSVASAGPGDFRDLGDVAEHHTMFVVTTGGGSWAVALEGSHDGASWAQLAQLSGSSAGPVVATVPTTDAPGALVRFVRANLTTLSGGSSPTVTATIASDIEGES